MEPPRARVRGGGGGRHGSTLLTGVTLPPMPYVSQVSDLPVSQLQPRPVRADELPELRALWWRHRAQGVTLPAEFGVIVIEGGRS